MSNSSQRTVSNSPHRTVCSSFFVDFKKIAITPKERVLIYGIGNLARQDDGLGHHLVQALENCQLPDAWILDANYQLNAEDALLISDYDVVLFADASKNEKIETPFQIRKIEADSKLNFSSHAMKAGSVVALCDQLYGRQPRCYWLEIPGKEWEIGETLSQKAKVNLAETLRVLVDFVESSFYA